MKLDNDVTKHTSTRYMHFASMCSVNPELDISIAISVSHPTLFMLDKWTCSHSNLSIRCKKKKKKNMATRFVSSDLSGSFQIEIRNASSSSSSSYHRYRLIDWNSFFFTVYQIEWEGKWIRVYRPDVECTNGIIHVIDDVLLKDSDVRVTGTASATSLASHLIMILVAKWLL